MNQEEHEAKLEENREVPIYKSYKKYHHIERLGNVAVEGILDGEVTVQTKVDGANLSVFWDEEDGLMIASRNHLIYRQNQTGVINAFNGAVDYVLNHPGVIDLVQRGYILRGEWLVKHSVQYGDDFWRKFYVFDVESSVGQLLNFHELIPILESAKILYIKPLAVLNRPQVSDLVPLTKGPDEFGANQKEGIVIKSYNFVNKFGRTQFAKLIAEDFREKNKLAFGASSQDPAELRFATKFVSREFVKKTIFTVADNRHEEPTIRHMGEILGRVYHDLFTEELWDFIKAEKVGAFNFKDLNRLCLLRTKSIALDFYNGVTNVHDNNNVSETKVESVVNE